MTPQGMPTPQPPAPGNRPSPAGPAPPSGLPPAPPASRPAAAAKGATPADPTPGKTPGLASPQATPGGPKLKGVALPRREGDRLERLGRGGFGEVWKVRYLNSEEAWKYLPRKAGSDLQAFRETMNARSIKHPNVVRVLDITEDEKNYIIRMDLVKGRDLDRVVSEDGVLDPGTACRYAIQISEALGAAHLAKVIHLDLKPSNILLLDGGETVMITDFGISATLSRGLFQIEPSQAPGTPYFLAPEQLEAKRGSAVDLGPGVDIWAMGITLYYLLSLSYPFPFKDNDPTAILIGPPRPLPEVVPYISKALWAIIERMLSRDPKSRYQDMGQVRAAFADYSDKVTCPSCQRTLSVKDIKDGCPEAGCARPREVAAYLSSRTLLREGHRAHARCEHQEAIQSYRKVVESAGPGTDDLRDEARALIAAAESEAQALARSLSSIGELQAAGDALNALREVDRVRKRFGTSSELRRIRLELLKAIRETCERADSEVKRLVKEANFRDAKLLLTNIEKILGYDPVRRDLEEGRVAPGAQPAQLRALFAFVDDRENFFVTCQKQLSKRLLALELGEAVDSLQKLQNFFPSPEHDRQMRLYTELAESLDFVRKGDLPKLRQLVEAGGESPPSEPVELVRITGQCDFLLTSLDPKKITALAEVSRRKEEAQKVIELLQASITKLKAELEAAVGSKRFDDQARILKRLQVIAQATDLVPAEESARFQDQLRKLQAMLEQAERKYQEGLRLVREHNYPQAVIALEAVEKISPGWRKDIPGIISECNHRKSERFEVYQQISEIFNRLMGEQGDLENFKLYFKLFQQTEAYRGVGSIVELNQKLNQVLVRLLSLQAVQLGQAPDDDQRLAVLVSTADTLLEMSKDMISGSFGQGAELNKVCLEFFGKVFGPLERGKVTDAEVDGRTAHLRGVITEMVRLQDAVKPLRAQEYLPHPAERASAALLACRPALLYRPEAHQRLMELLALHGELSEMTDDPKVRRQLKKVEGDLKRTLSWISIERTFHTMIKYAVWAAVPLVTAVVVAVALYFYFQNRLENSRADLARNVLKPLNVGSALPAGMADEAFFKRLLVGVTDDGPSPDGGAALELALWVGKKKGQLERLQALRVTEAAGAAQAAAWNEGLDKLTQRSVVMPVKGKLDEYLKMRFRVIVDNALVLHPSPRKFDAIRPYSPLKEALGEVEGVKNLGLPFGGKETSSRYEKLEQLIEQAEKFIRESDKEGGQKLAAAPGEELEEQVYRLAHIGRFTIYYFQDLAWESLQVYRNDGKASAFEEKLHQKIRKLLGEREAWMSDGVLKPTWLALRAKNLPERSPGDVETPETDPERAVYRALLEALKPRA
jgi:serine/threonine protein kinase